MQERPDICCGTGTFGDQTRLTLPVAYCHQVFYQVGFDGVIYTCDVTTSDITTLKNRGLAFAITSSPYIITAFAGPSAAEGFYEDISWRWAFGTFCILTPVIAIPFFGTLMFYQHKAKQRGLLTNAVDSGRNVIQSILHYVNEFDGKREDRN